MRKWLPRLGLALFGVGIALVIGLLALRAINRPELIPESSDCVPADGDWLPTIIALNNNYRIPCDHFYWDIYPTGEFYNLISLNNYGLHDTPLTLEKAPGVFRILIVGDSFPQGWQVPLEQGFPYLLEQQLNADSVRQVEVINLSVDDYGTSKELLLYAAFGWRFQADVVLLSFYLGNDLKDNSYILTEHEEGYLEQPQALLTLDDSGSLQIHQAPTLDPQRFDSPAWAWLVGMSEHQTPVPVFATPSAPIVTTPEPRTMAYPVDLGLYLPEDNLWSQSWALTEALIVQFQTLAQAQGSRFGVILIPDRRAVHVSDWDTTVVNFPFIREANPLTPGDRLDAFLAQANIPALNLTYALSGWALSHPDERLYYIGDGHFNANGHAVSAQRIRFWLQEQGWVN
ncbi:MAG: SGNH/GDSL hydrolase family protein [Anaerolineae bacterium]|nr:SGNH/GDSL hydrolase family protein [Anaerolineae bacterium]